MLQLQQKAVASEIFKGKKDNYPQSVPRLFISTRLGEPLALWARPLLLLCCFLPSGSDFLSPCGVTGVDEISPKVLQALGSEPIQVRHCLSLLPGTGGGRWGTAQGVDV